MNRGQSAFEYLLLIGAGVLVSAILLVIVTNTQSTTTDVVTNDTQDYTGKLKNLLSTGSTTDCRYCDGIFVGVDQENSITSTMITDGSITSSDVNPTQIQLRVTKDCGTQAISKIDATGNATCIPITTTTTWTTTGNDQYSTPTGNVGIGTTNPTTKLAVNGNTSITGPTTINGNTNITGTTTIKGTTTINGTINATNHTITGLAAPISATDAATKEYVDAASGKGMYEVCYILNTTASHATCATEYTMLAHFYGGDICWTMDAPLGATNPLGTYFTFGDAAMGFDVGFAHYSYAGYTLAEYWGNYNIGGGNCVGEPGWAGVVSPVVLVMLNNQGFGYNSKIYKQNTQTMAVCCK